MTDRTLQEAMGMTTAETAELRERAERLTFADVGPGWVCPACGCQCGPQEWCCYLCGECAPEADA